MKILYYTINESSVSTQSDKYGTRAYINSAKGRAQLEAECPPEIVQQVYAVWGDTPTVEEPVLEHSDTALSGPSIDQRISTLEDAITAMWLGGAV